MLNPARDKKAHFTQLDGLRCIAVMSVLVCHWLHYKLLLLIPLGSMGVNLFFVLSGFLITRILLMSKDENEGNSIFPPIKRFYIRRTFRIFPIYYLTIIFLLLINFPVVREDIAWLFTYTLNIKMGLPTLLPGTFVGYLTHLWSLSVEEQFYILFPFLIFFIPKSKIKLFIYVVISLGVISRLLLYVFAAPKLAMYLLTPCCFDAFGMGSLLAYYLLYEREFLGTLLKKNYILLIMIVAFIGDIVYSHYYINDYIECQTVLERFLFSLCCFWFVGIASIGSYSGIKKQFLENKAVVYIGKISYGIYIYHDFVFSLLTMYLNPVLMKYFHVNPKYLLDPAFSHNNIITTALLLFTITFIASSLSWYLLELPISKLKEKLTAQVKYNPA